MGNETILIVEDDPDILELLQYNLQRKGFRVVLCRTGEEGIKEATARRPDLVLLDLMLPGMQGLEVCRALRDRRQTAETPIIIITAKGEESDVVVGLEMGADDYVTKPFGPRELVARIRAVLRRGGPVSEVEAAERIVQGDLTIDSARHEVRLDGEPVDLTLAEFRLLRALVSNPGRVFTRAQLVDRITEGEHTIIERNVDVHVGSIRKKLGDLREAVVTVRGIGYKWRD